MGVVSGIFDKWGENYSLFASWGEVVVFEGPAVSRIPDINGVEVKGVSDVGNVADRGMRRLVLLIIAAVIRAVIINFAIHIVVFFNDGDQVAAYLRSEGTGWSVVWWRGDGRGRWWWW